jgi:hypothetical protein
MAIINCRECNTEVSDAANACPKCGADDPHLLMHRIKTVFYVLACLAGAAFLLHKWLSL